MPAEILRVEEVDAHRDPAMLARPPEGRAALGEPGDRDRRVRPCPRLHVKADSPPGFRLGNSEVVLRVLAPPREPPAVALGPDPQDRLDVVVADPAVGAVLRDLEQGRIAGEGPHAYPPHEPASGHHVELGDAVGELGRVVVGDAAHPRAEPNPLRLEQGLGQGQVGRRDILPGARVVLAEPGLIEAELVGQHQQLQVLVEGIRVLPVRRMTGHAEEAESHAGPPNVAPEPAAAASSGVSSASLRRVGAREVPRTRAGRSRPAPLLRRLHRLE